MKSSVRAAACMVALALASSARAEDNPFEALARMITAPKAEYRGPTLPFPESGPRPVSSGWRACSDRVPVCVHAPRRFVQKRLARALKALETAYAWLLRQGWPLPYPDAGLGGSNAFDLYFVSGLDRAARAAADDAIAWSDLDAATSYALLDASLPSSALERCAMSVLTEAALLGQAPVDTDGARRANAAFVTWLATGELGCDEGVGIDAQNVPWLGSVGDADTQVAAMALWLSVISQRHDGGNGRFIRELWELTRKRSEHLYALHVAPDFIRALSAALDKAGESLDQSAIEFAVTRYFAASAGAGSPLALLSREAHVPVTLAPPLSSLPKHLAACEPLLATYGSAYVQVPTPGAHEGMRLQVWLRGDRGVRWSLVAIRLDAQGHELSRMEAPPRNVPHSFLPIELGSDTAAVLLVVIKLPWQRVDPRVEDDEDCFRLVLDAGR